MQELGKGGKLSNQTKATANQQVQEIDTEKGTTQSKESAQLAKYMQT